MKCSYLDPNENVALVYVRPTVTTRTGSGYASPAIERSPEMASAPPRQPWRMNANIMAPTCASAKATSLEVTVRPASTVFWTSATIWRWLRLTHLLLANFPKSSQSRFCRFVDYHFELLPAFCIACIACMALIFLQTSFGLWRPKLTRHQTLNLCKILDCNSAASFISEVKAQPPRPSSPSRHPVHIRSSHRCNMIQIWIIWYSHEIHEAWLGKCIESAHEKARIALKKKNNEK